MPLQNVLHDSVGASEEIRLTRVGSLHLLLERHGLVGGVLLSKTGDIPNSDGEIHRSGNDEVLLGMELSTPGGEEELE